MTKGTTQYDAFAADYDWIFSDPVRVGERRVEELKRVLESLPPDAAILDCACGTGLQALAMARRGYRVKGADASPGMIARAQDHAAEAGVEVEFAACRWERLPQTYAERFDLAICCGNAIAHCRDEAEMLRPLRGIRAVLKKSARLLIDTRNWEKLLADRVRFTWLGVRVREGKRCIPVYVRTFPRSDADPILIEVLLVFEQDGKVWLKGYSITYYPFRLEELISRLEATGFSEIDTDYAEEHEAYSVAARAV